MSSPDYIVEIQGLNGHDEQLEENCSSSRKGRHGARPWLAVYWRCCKTYSRIYRNVEATTYTGRCPRCGKLVSAQIGSDGTTARFFEAR